jgi:hypothetical protein
MSTLPSAMMLEFSLMRVTYRPAGSDCNCR